MNTIKPKADWLQRSSIGLTVLLSVVVILLIIQNRELKRAINGSTVLTRSELDGATTELAYNDSTKKYLLFVLSTTCPHCEKTLPIWQSFAQNKSENCNVFGISIHNLEQTRSFLANKIVGFYTASVGEDTSFERKYKIVGVPETILISGKGTVEKTWVGELTPKQAIEINALIGGSTSLPN